MAKPIIILARPFPDALMQAMSELGELRVASEAGNKKSDLESLLEGASVWVASAVDPVPAQLIEQFPPPLRLIANIGVGTDNIDLAVASARGIYASNTPVVTEDTADLAMSLMLATCRRLTECERLLRAGEFATGAGHLGIRVHGKKLGIIGFGEIGQAVARRANGFGMEILYTGPSRKPDAEAGLNVTYYPELEQLLAESDIVSLHCSLNESTHHLMNAYNLGRMKDGAVLINCGRGSLVDEAALVAALSSGRLGGAGLDVFEFEPKVTKALYKFDNVTLLPHIGSATAECRAEMGQRLIANIREFLTSGVPLDAVNTINPADSEV